eukprot:scaffold90574_cov63-Phaeocystis_antarctica.AAC.2
MTTTTWMLLGIRVQTRHDKDAVRRRCDWGSHHRGRRVQSVFEPTHGKTTKIAAYKQPPGEWGAAASHGSRITLHITEGTCRAVDML